MMDGIELIPAKTIVTRTKTRAWFGADYNMNIYRGCSHGCIYCDSRSDCYRNYDFDRVKVKQDALRVIRDDLRRIRKRGVVMTGAMSDPYNPLEEKFKLSRNALELINAFHFGAAVTTKSPLIARDIDVLSDIAQYNHVIVKLTVTTADDGLCKKIEPYVAPSSERLRALERIASAGIFCGVLMMPLMPWINDNADNIAGIVNRSADAGAKFIYPSLGLSIRDGQREYLYGKLDAAFPGLREKYAGRFGTNYQCASPNARHLWDIFRNECRRRGILYNMGDIIAAGRARHEPKQYNLF